MPPVARVRPGDLITATFINDLLDRLDEIETRLAELEPGSSPSNQPVITLLIPAGTAAEPIRVATELRIVGQNFRFTLGAHRVFFDNLLVTAFKSGSNDNLLILDVPTALSVPESGRSVNLRVENGLDSVTRTITVMPFSQTLLGEVDVLWRDEVSPNPSPNPIVTGQQALFAYTLRSRASRQAAFQLSPVISVTAWQGLLQVLDASQNLLADRSISLAPNEERNFFVRITQIPAGANGQQFTLAVSAASGPVSGGDPRRPFTVGTPTAPSDNTINLSSPSFSAVDFNTGAAVPNASFDETTGIIRLPPGALGTLEYLVTFELTGTYQLTRELSAGATGWTVNVVPGSYTETTPNTSESPRVAIRPDATATTPAELTFRIRRDGASTEQTRRFQLQRIA